MTTRSAAARAWYLGTSVLVGAALVVQVVVSLRGSAAASSDMGDIFALLVTRLVRLASFFTIESNVLVLVLAASLALRPGRDGRLWRVLHLDALIGIVVSGLVFTTVLAPIVKLTGPASAATIIFHYVAPCAVILGWLVFGPRPRVDRATLIAAAAWPAVWIVWTVIHGAVTGWYPYLFLNVSQLGAVAAARNIALVLVGAVAIALALWWADRHLPATGVVQSESTDDPTP